jgi:hypothetical protein
MAFPFPALKHVRDSSASEIAEAAVILPLLFMLLLSIYWFGRAFAIYGTIHQAAREAVRVAATPSCANCQAPQFQAQACPWQGSALPCDNIVLAAVTQVLGAANLDPKRSQPLMPSPVPPACPGIVPEGLCAPDSANQVVICRNVVLNQNNSSSPVCGAIVSFQYPYQFALPFTSLGNQNILLKAQAELGEEN